MDSGLAEKVVLVTGASGGIGRALAEEFAGEGAHLVLHAHGHVAELEEWVAAQPWRDRALVARADVSRADEVDAVLRAGVERFGRVDVAVANAGTWPPESLPLHRMSEERFRHVLDVNLLGIVWTARAFLRRLEETGPRPDHGASLVMIGSTAGRFGEAGHSEYATSKAALVGLMLSLKNEIVALDPRGRVNLVQPGWTVTHMARPALEQPGAIGRVVRTMPLKQLGLARDVARAVLHLASPLLSRHVSGETITVAGGMEGRVQWEPGEIDEAAIRAELDR